MRETPPYEVTLEVRDRCLCLHLQRAARVVARRFDEAMRPFGLTNGQFSLMMALNRPQPPRISDLAPLLAMDRTTLTAALKVLERRGLVVVNPDRDDRRSRRLVLSDTGGRLLAGAVPVWRATHDALDAEFGAEPVEALRRELARIGRPGAAATETRDGQGELRPE